MPIPIMQGDSALCYCCCSLPKAIGHITWSWWWVLSQNGYQTAITVVFSVYGYWLFILKRTGKR